MKHFFVINPHSFAAFGNIGDVISEIEACFSDKNSDTYKIHISRYPRDAIAAVHRYVSGCSKDETVRIYAIGGDGIMFECLNGMIDFPNAELTGVPYGNANDFYRIFGSEHIEKFRDIKGLLDAPSRPIDVIHCGSNYSIIGLSIGLVGQTIMQANKYFPKLPKKLLRKHIGLGYSLCAVKTLFNKKLIRQKYLINIDGENFSGQYCNIQISNYPCNGGDCVPNPYARLDDGLLNVLFTRTDKKLKVIKCIGDYNAGCFEKHDIFIHRTCKFIEIKSDELLHVEMDGEGFYSHELKVKIIPGGVKVFAPEGLDLLDYSCKAYKSKKAGNKKA